MQLTHSFPVPLAVEEAWPVLLDIERVAPCLPGATLGSVGADEVAGKLRVKIGPITVTYRGSARLVDQDEAARRIVVEASGKEARGSGTVEATVTATLQEAGEHTEVKVRTKLSVTGRPAQYGRAMMTDVGGKLLERFADCLADEIGLPVGHAVISPVEEEPPAPVVDETAERIVPAQEVALADLPAPELAPEPAPAVIDEERPPVAPVSPAPSVASPDPASTAASTLPPPATPVRTRRVPTAEVAPAPYPSGATPAGADAIPTLADATTEPAPTEGAPGGGSSLAKRVALLAGPATAAVVAAVVVVVVLRRRR